MLRVSRVLRYQIVNPRIAHNRSQMRKDEALNLYPVVGFEQTKLGAMVLNKPDNNNNITEECCDQLFRFVNSYHHDHTVENIWIENKGDSFSGGADIDQLKQNQLYLDKLFRLSIMLARLNKPVFAKVNGSVRGIASYILTMFSLPIATERSSMRIDQTAKGFVPIFGGSHRLSRLPCNVGLYLALTGQKIDSSEMMRLGILKANSLKQFSNKQMRKNMSDANLFFHVPYSANAFKISELRREAIILQRMRKFDFFIEEAQKEIFNSRRNFYGKFAFNQYNIAKTDYENTVNSYHSLSEKERIINNYFEMRQNRPFNYLKDKQMIEDARTDQMAISRFPTHRMIRIFGQDSLEKVMAELEADGSDWAKQTSQKIRRNDPLALHLTFYLLKQAKESSWVECLERQYGIARRLLDVSNVQLKEHNSGSLKVLKNPFSDRNIEDISQKQLEPFINKNLKPEETFEHDSPKYAFYPTSDYWKQLPDSGRHYLNRTLFDDVHLKNHEQQVRRFLQMNNIDYRDRSYNMDVLREAMYKQNMYERLFNLEKERIRGILKDYLSLKNVQSKRQEYLEEKVQNKSQFNQYIKEKVKKYFQTRFEERYSDMMQTAEIAGKESRMDIFRSYVDTMTQNIVLNGGQYEKKASLSNLSHGGIVRFDSQGRNIFEAETEWEKNNAAIQQLKQVAKKRGTIDQLSEQAKTLEKNQHLFVDDGPSEWELFEEKKHQALMDSYGVPKVDLRNRAVLYRTLMEKAAKTSQQIYSLLGWEDEDIQTMLVNAPKDKTTIQSFARNTLQNASNIQERINNLNKYYSQISQSKQLNQIKNDNDEANQKMRKDLPLFFDLQVIPRPFRDTFLNLLKVVINYFTEQYEQKGTVIPSFRKNQKSSLLDQWAERGLKADFTELMKHDVEYVFSYLGALYLKEVSDQIVKQSNADLPEFLLNKFGLNFKGHKQGQIKNQVINFLYVLLDMHGGAKHKILMPQSKLLDFISRQRVMKESEGFKGLSYQSLISLISKDRKRLKDYIEGKTPLLGYEPELMLNRLITEREKHNIPTPQFKERLNIEQSNQLDERAHIFRAKANILPQKKHLVHGFLGYLMRFEVILQKIAGFDMFLPETIRRKTNQKAYEEITRMLRNDLSEQEWLDRKVGNAIHALLEFRMEKQKTMTKGQLALFDADFCELFTPESISMLVKFEQCSEEKMARQITQKSYESPEEEEDLYEKIMGQIKNPRALRIVNNLIMGKHVIEDRAEELHKQRDRRNIKYPLYGNELAELTSQLKTNLPSRTLSRLFNEAYQYQDSKTVNQKDHKQLFLKIPGVAPIKDTSVRFLSQVKEITDSLPQEDLKSALEKKIERITMIQQ